MKSCVHGSISEMKKRQLADKERRLHERCNTTGRVRRFSGGVDSTLLLRVARDVLGAAQVWR